MGSKPATKRVGRPRSFNSEEALDQAMRVFWCKGFEGASLKDLTEAMHMQPASIYAAFGNKQALFEKALERYLTGVVGFMHESLIEPTALGVAERILHRGAEFLTKPDHPRGCLLTQTALSSGEEGESVRQRLIGLRTKEQQALRRRFERAKREGDLAQQEDAGDLARFVMAVFQGMTVQAIDGASYDELLRLTRIALRAWPT